MHEALRVPEILLIIFNYVTDDLGEPLLPSLAAVAGTCRAFQRQAEEIIWYKIPSVSTLYRLLPPQMLDKKPWALSRRAFSGPNWVQFMDRASLVRVLMENDHGRDERCSAIFLAMAALRVPPLLTPNLRKLEWQTSRPSLGPAINLFISSSLQSLEINVKLLVNHVIRAPLGSICPVLKHLKITGNGRSAAGTISSVLRTLHCLETVACPSLDNDAFVHIAQSKNLSYLAVDMRWSVLTLDALRDLFHPGSFQGLQTLYWKDYDLDALSDIFLMPDISPSNIHLEIESFCTSPSLRTFLHAFTAKFPRTETFSLVHDIGASRRFGLQASTPGREHHLDACDLKSLFALKSLRALNLVDLGHLRLDDELVKTIASAFPELERLDLRADAAKSTTASVTFDGILSLLQDCPKLQTLGLSIDAEDMLRFSETTVRQDRVTHLHLKGSIFGSRRAEVDEMLKRVLPGLKTVEESLNGVRNVRALWELDAVQTSMIRRSTSRRTRNSLEST